MSSRFLLFTIALALAAGTPTGHAQQSGPISAPPDKEVRRIPAASTPPAPPIPVSDIIRQFTAREDEFSREHLRYGFHRTVRLQEFPADGSEGGELNLDEEIYLGANGRRYEKVTKEAGTELKNSQLTFQDLKELARIIFFPLTSEDVARYNITYVGSQRLDELQTYVLRVQPKHLERRIRQLEGLIYVDDHDMAIVKIYGRWVTEVDNPDGALPFSLFDVQREPVDGKYWFPDYARSEDVVAVKEGQTRLRLTIHMTGFKAGATAPVPEPTKPTGNEPPPSTRTPPLRLKQCIRFTSQSNTTYLHPER